MKLCLEQMYCHGVSHLECLFVSDVYVCLFYLNKVCNEEDKSCGVCKAVQKEASPQQVSGGCSLHVFFSDISHHMYDIYGDIYVKGLYSMHITIIASGHKVHIWVSFCRAGKMAV